MAQDGRTKAKGKDQDKGDKEEGPVSVDIQSYVLTYTNGQTRQVWTDEEIDDLKQRWASALGRAGDGKLFRIPASGVLTNPLQVRTCGGCQRDMLHALCPACQKPTFGKEEKDEETGELEPVVVEVELPVVVARADLVMDLSSIPDDIEDDGGDEEEEEEEEEPPVLPDAEAPKKSAKSTKSTKRPLELPAGFPGA